MRLLAFAAVLPLLGSCANTVSKLPMLASSAGTQYLLGPGDVLQINVFGESDLTGSYRVSDTGTLAMPLVGPISAQGLTLEQFQQQLGQRLDAGVVKSPNVTVQVSEYRPFFILGEVKNPGSYAYVPDMTVLTAVAIAGGFSFRAAQDEVSVMRRIAGGPPRESRALRDARILPGDVVFVFERHL
jgi:polysaccharide export outer membrane protein